MSDPISESEIAELESYFEEKLHPLFEATSIYKIDQLVGSAGSFETFADMIAHRFYTPQLTENIISYKFNSEEFEQIYEQIIKSTHKERLHTPGLITMRVDMIVVAAILTHFVRQKLKVQRMHLSGYALKEGVIAEMAKEAKKLV
ncbi:Ppx/GppA phosphatase family protein [compost metagenome]